MRKTITFILFVWGIATLSTTVFAYEFSETLAINGVVSGAIQCQDLSESAGAENTCESSVPFQPSLSYRPTNTSTLFFKLGFAAGNGLNDKTPFVIPPWGADLEDDVENINGSGRDHLLEAWYRHFFALQKGNSIGVTVGIIDASQYLDQNAYANDEYTQFMNPALSNAPNTLLPSYDFGVVAEWFLYKWTLSAVVMDVHQYLIDEKYTFYGLQAGYTLDTRFGAGHYRVLLNGDRNLIDLAGKSKQKNDILILSFDQAFGQKVGGFLRMGWRLDDEQINYQAIYTGGIDIKGNSWNRSLDNIGLGYAYLSGGDGNIIRTRIAEIYYRYVIVDYLALTADIQHMQDEKILGGSPSGFIYGLRATIEF